MAQTYKEKLEEFIKVVPLSKSFISKNQLSDAENWGEVVSGSPIVPIPPKNDKNPLAALERVAMLARAGTIACTDNATFTSLTGLTHTGLLRAWSAGGPAVLTSCNGFVGRAAAAMGVKGLGGFDVEKTMIAMGKRHCWVTPKSGERPQYGDVFETRSRRPGAGFDNIHVGVSLYFEGDKWFTIEGGQGGPSTGCDKVARVAKPYRTEHMLGWVDMRMLASGLGPMPDWLPGTWIIYAGDARYVYTFNRYGEVSQKAWTPIKGVSADTVPARDTGQIQNMRGDSIEIAWATEGGVERFTYDRMNSLSAVNERMTGVAADGSVLKGVKL